MPSVSVNYLAVLVASVVAMAEGFFWYGPAMFGKEWMKLMGYSKESMKAAQKEMSKTYAVAFAATLVTAYVLSHIIDFAGAETLSAGATTGFWVWLGFVAPVQLTAVLYGGKKHKLFYIDTGYQLVALAVMGAILAVWV